MNKEQQAWIGASATIGRFVENFQPDTLSEAHYAAVCRALIDTVSVAVAGCREEACTIARGYLAGRRALQHATCWGPGIQLPIEDAAFQNGVAGHVLDFDDVSSPMRGHPSIVLLPALVALAEALDKSGRDLAAAYAAGFEVIVRLSRPMMSDHYAKGWHSTASIGVLGSTAACAKLLGLSVKQTSNALGLAVAQAAGTRSNFGTMAKSFQAGHSAACAVRSAMLAHHGFDSAPEAIDGKYGFMSLYADGESLAQSLSLLGKDKLELLDSGIEIKKYPLCYATHRTIDGVLDLREQYGLTLDQVSHVEVTANYRATAPLIHASPQTGLEAKFSMQYAVAAALADGYVKLRSFRDENVRRPHVQAFFSRVSVHEEAGPAFPRWNNIVVHLKDGRHFEKRVTMLRGSAEMPLTDEQLFDKASDCFSFQEVLDPSEFLEMAMQLRDVSIRQIVAALPVVDN